MPVLPNNVRGFTRLLELEVLAHQLARSRAFQGPGGAFVFLKGYKSCGGLDKGRILILKEQVNFFVLFSQFVEILVGNHVTASFEFLNKILVSVREGDISNLDFLQRVTAVNLALALLL